MSLFGKRAAAGEGAERELAGDLDGALHVYLRDHDEAAVCRVTLLLADREPDVPRRLAVLARALPLAAAHPAVRARYALARVDLGHATPSSLLPSEAATLGRELMALGELEGAARAFRLAGMHEPEASAWAAAGEIERTEQALARGLDDARASRALAGLSARFDLLVATGQRCAALALARDAEREAALAARADALEARLCRWPRVALRIDGDASTWVLGHELVLGRSGCDLDVPAPAVSRRHLRLARAADGAATVEDLGSSNGTFLAAARLARPLVIAGALELTLGGDVKLSLAPGDGGIIAGVAGARYTLPLGDAVVGVGALVRVGDGVRLMSASGRLALGGVAAPEGIDLALGDVVRCGERSIEVVEP